MELSELLKKQRGIEKQHVNVFRGVDRNNLCDLPRFIDLLLLRMHFIHPSNLPSVRHPFIYFVDSGIYRSIRETLLQSIRRVEMITIDTQLNNRSSNWQPLENPEHLSVLHYQTKKMTKFLNPVKRKWRAHTEGSHQDQDGHRITGHLSINGRIRTAEVHRRQAEDYSASPRIANSPKRWQWLFNPTLTMLNRPIRLVRRLTNPTGDPSVLSFISSMTGQWRATRILTSPSKSLKHRLRLVRSDGPTRREADSIDKPPHSVFKQSWRYYWSDWSDIVGRWHRRGGGGEGEGGGCPPLQRTQV